MRLPTSRRYAASRSAAALAVAAGVGLVACTNGSTPPAPPSSSSSVSATSTVSVPGPTAVTTATTAPSITSLPYPSDVPAAARVNSPEGAQAFVRHYFDVANGLYVNPRAGGIEPLGSPSCKTCAALARIFAGFAERKERFTTAPQQIVDIVRAPDASPSGSTKFDVVVRLVASQRVDATGKVLETVKDGRAVLATTTVWVGDHWLLAESKVRQA